MGGKISEIDKKNGKIARKCVTFWGFTTQIIWRWMTTEDGYIELVETEKLKTGDSGAVEKVP